MNPIQFVPVNIRETIQVFEKDGKIIILNAAEEDVSEFYLVETRKTKQTEMVIVSPKKKKDS
jgi:hypothetical protein